MKRKPIYMYQCIKCKVYMYTTDMLQKHCGRLTSWINGTPEKGINMNSPIVKIKVSGTVEMSQENLERILTYEDIHTGLLYSLHMGYVNAKGLTFELPDEYEG